MTFQRHRRSIPEVVAVNVVITRGQFYQSNLGANGEESRGEMILGRSITVQWIEMKVIMLDPPRIILLPTVHHYAVSAKIAHVCVCIGRSGRARRRPRDRLSCFPMLRPRSSRCTCE